MNSLGADLFVGRARERARIRAELDAGRNLVLTGAFGIGRTELLRHVSNERGYGRRFVFMDGMLTPAKLCEQLIRELGADSAGLGWRAVRSRLAGLRSSGSARTVLVLDDVAKVTQPKLEFLRWLRSDGGFQLIVVAERFLPADGLIRLRTSMYPAPLFSLGPLTNVAARLFFEQWSRLHRLGWRTERVHALALATHGYPLGMRQAAEMAEALVARQAGQD